MPGTINWTASVNIGGPQPFAQVYDKNGITVDSDIIPCQPPVNCPIPMENVQFGKYKAAVLVGSNRYYYVQGQSVITVPNDEANATVIELNHQNPSYQLNITVGYPT